MLAVFAQFSFPAYYVKFGVPAHQEQVEKRTLQEAQNKITGAVIALVQ